jgi:hypothetical protein
LEVGGPASLFSPHKTVLNTYLSIVKEFSWIPISLFLTDEILEMTTLRRRIYLEQIGQIQ